MKGLTDQLQSSGGDQADLTPMIDCVFLLLLFFIVTTSFTEESNLFKVEMPKAEKAQVVALDNTVQVVIDKSGKMAVGKQIVNDEQLWALLSERYEKEAQDKPVLVVRGDKGCPYEKAVLVMDIAQELGISEVSWAVSKE